MGTHLSCNKLRTPAALCSSGLPSHPSVSRRTKIGAPRSLFTVRPQSPNPHTHYHVPVGTCRRLSVSFVLFYVLFDLLQFFPSSGYCVFFLFIALPLPSSSLCFSLLPPRNITTTHIFGLGLAHLFRLGPCLRSTCRRRTLSLLHHSSTIVATNHHQFFNTQGQPRSDCRLGPISGSQSPPRGP